jgi:dihydrofolate reductase
MMRKLVLGMFVSLDGFVCGPNGEFDWVFKSGDDDTDKWIIENFREAGLIGMGSRSFAAMSGYWPTADTAFAPPMNEIPKVVFTRKGLSTPVSRTAPAGSWANPYVANGTLADEVARLKAQPGKDIRVLGGADFARSLVGQRLVDEYHLLMCSVALGQGKSLFAEVPTPLELKLISTRTFSGGAVALVYRPRDA